MIGYPKPEPRKKSKAREKRAQRKETSSVRAYCFGRERNICRCCRMRAAESLHEMRFRSQGGKVSRRNSIAVCGDGVRGCHGFLQRHEITPAYDVLGAEDVVLFTIESPSAADWMHLPIGHTIVAAPLRDMQFDIERDARKASSRFGNKPSASGGNGGMLADRMGN